MQPQQQSVSKETVADRGHSLPGSDADSLKETGESQILMEERVAKVSPEKAQAVSFANGDTDGNIPHNEQNNEAQQPTKKEKDFGPRMTKEFLRDHCKQQKLYVTPYLNDTLYLHYKGCFVTIENLEEYTGLKCLWLECNGLQKIENLEAQTEMRCLFMHQNLIQKLENLEPLQKLDSLNLNNNYIKTIENLSCLKDLSTLQLAHNNVQTVQDIEHLKDCPSISVLDLSHNKLDDPDILYVFEAMPNLRVLNLMGNEVIKKISNYRKIYTVRLKKLTYLDDRPVFPKDRACAEAWNLGGWEAEKEERQQWETRERRKIQDSIDALSEIRKKAEEKRRHKEMKENDEGVFSENGVGNDMDIPGQSTDPVTHKKIQTFVDETMQAHDDFLDEMAGTVEEDLQESSGRGKEQLASTDSDCNADKDEEIPSAIPVAEKQTNSMATCGALVTELENSETIDTINLENHEKIYIDDLPDLEELEISETEDVLTSQPVYRPKIEVISAASDESDSDLEDIEKLTAGKKLIEEIEITAANPEPDLFIRSSERQKPLQKSMIIEEILLEPVSNTTETVAADGLQAPLIQEVLECLETSDVNEPDKPTTCLIEELD
ncbi:dynein assembly factor 1, axonemal-like isoform X1 [Acipenser oxyrinchus oxyrinchus]|uniref:Dynein assembly factor 1, axonemal-like isoform X1 n=1 Tax=Acipenser oxyrinchus oxyrinchus TaxID=40147 RepID=A0AAD8G1R1_ACIOX|nr:dynein assembly factor 1, axonemal-like isoform X1 [Acipenser oxyrinchus oxyrinchus]